MKKFLPISALVLSVLACGLPAASQIVYPRHSAAPTPPAYAVQMIVSGTWHIRTAAGETNPLVDGKNTLHDGELVTCTKFVMVGDGLWCEHEKGWSNARGMTSWLEKK